MRKAWLSIEAVGDPTSTFVDARAITAVADFTRLVEVEYDDDDDKEKREIVPNQCRYLLGSTVCTASISKEELMGLIDRAIEAADESDNLDI